MCFDVDGTATHGTLRVPAHREGQRLAAALLLPGSGPVDRNGDVPGLNLTPRTLALIAEVLAQHGHHEPALRQVLHRPDRRGRLCKGPGPDRPRRLHPAGRGRLPRARRTAGNAAGGAARRRTQRGRPVRTAHRGAGTAAPGRDRADRAHGRAAAQHHRTAGDGTAERGRRRGHPRPCGRNDKRQRGPARDRRVPCRAAGGHQRAAARRRAQAQAGAARRGERAVRAPGGRRASGGGGGEGGARHARARHRGHQGRQHPGFRDQAARGGPGRRRDHRTGTAGAGGSGPFPAPAQARPATNPCSRPRWSPR